MISELNSQDISKAAHSLELDPFTGAPLEANHNDAQSDDPTYDASVSLGASINESLMMPVETLSTSSEEPEAAVLAEDNKTRRVSDQSKIKKQAQALNQKIRKKPYAYIIGVMGLGLILGKYGSGSAAKVSPL